MLLYGHYDVVPAGDESKWESPPFEATERDGAIYGRGAADSKSNILVHVGALRAWGGKPPVGIKLVIEGQEEIGSALTTFPPSQPELFAADAMVIADMGSLRPGVPTLTDRAARDGGRDRPGRERLPARSTAGSSAAPLPMRCSCCCTRSRRCTTRTATSPCPACGARSGPAPRYSDDEFRDLAEIVPGMPFFGTGGLGERIWSGPAITVTGIDAQPVDEALNAVVPHARAKLGLRIHPEEDAAEAQAALIRHLEGLRPFGIALEVEAAETGKGYFARTTGPAYEAARAAFGTVWGSEASFVATGGSIPLVSALQEAAPDAEILLLGTTDGFANIHAPNERVLLDEFEKAVAVETEFFSRFAETLREEGETVTSTPEPAPAGTPADAAHPGRDRARREQDAEPRDPVRLAVRDRDRPLRPARLGRHQGHLPGRRAAADRRRGDRPGRFHATVRRPAGRVRPGRRVHGRRGNGGNPEPALRRRNPLPLHVVRRQLPQLRRRRDHPRRDDRRRPRRGRRTDRGADPQARQGLVGGDADADPRLHRRPLEHCLGCGVPRADTPGRSGVQERRPQPARGHGRRLRGRRRRLRRQLPDHAARRRPDRDHERRESRSSTRSSRSTSRRTSTSGSPRRSWSRSS